MMTAMSKYQTGSCKLVRAALPAAFITISLLAAPQANADRAVGDGPYLSELHQMAAVNVQGVVFPGGDAEALHYGHTVCDLAATQPAAQVAESLGEVLEERPGYIYEDGYEWYIMGAADRHLCPELHLLP